MNDHFEALQERRPKQSQPQQPGQQQPMQPAPVTMRAGYRAAGKLQGKVALISGGDSGIGRATAVHFAAEGADVAIIYRSEEADALKTVALIEEQGQRGLSLRGDVGEPEFCRRAVDACLDAFGRLDVLVNNAAEQHPQERPSAIKPDQLLQTFRTNFFGYFWLAQSALAYIGKGGSIINLSSVTAYRGSAHLLDYSSTKGAITSFTRSLAKAVAGQGIRVNAVAPGPIWTPLIPATFDADHVEEFGGDTLMKRAGQPCEVATCLVFLASEDASYLTGQTLHPNGGDFIES